MTKNNLYILQPSILAQLVHIYSMKIAIPVFNERVSPLLDTAQSFIIVSRNPEEVSQVWREQSRSVLHLLQAEMCTVVVYNRVSRELADMLATAGISLLMCHPVSVKKLLCMLTHDWQKVSICSKPKLCCRKQFGIITDGKFKERSMKIGITTSGSDEKAEVDQRFGRARAFMVFDEESSSWSFVENSQNYNAPQGAGIQAAGTVLDEGVSVIITGHVGPKAHSVLKAADVAIFTGAEGSVLNALQMYRDGKLTSSDEADVEGHW